MSTTERAIIPYLPVRGAPTETIFSDTYVSIDDTELVRSWSDLSHALDEGEYSYILISNSDAQDPDVVQHDLYGNTQMEWWGTSEEPLERFTTRRSDDLFSDVQRQLATSNLNLLPTTKLVNVIFMNPNLLGIDTSTLRDQIKREV